MPDQLYSTPVYLTGDMIASLGAQPSNDGNPGDANYGIILPGVEALGTGQDYYRLVWSGNPSTQGIATQFSNGQMWTLQRYTPGADTDGDPLTGEAGWSTITGYTDLTPKNDFVNGLGAGDEYIVFEAPGGQFLLYDINGGLPATPTTLTYRQTDENGDLALGDNDGNLDFYDAYTAICFAQGTRIDTVFGPMPVELLRPGALVRTRDHAYQPLRWVGRRIVSPVWMRRAPNLRPVRISAGALGPGLPAQDLTVSPQHRILLRSAIVARVSGQEELLVPAKALIGLPGITLVEAPGWTIYFHLLFDRHEIIFANGAEAESLLTGREALRSLTAAAKQELLTLFPDLRSRERSMALVRPVMASRPARNLAVRHVKNRKPLVAAP